MDELKSDIYNNCISYPTSKTYFTNNYVISNFYHNFAIKYSDIIWMYPVEKYYNGAYLGTDLVLRLKNKRKLGIIYSEEFCDIIIENNPNILFGSSNENKKRYNEIIKNENNN